MQAKDYDSAWGMLTAESQSKLRNKEKLQKLCEGPLATIFAKDARAEVKLASYREDKKINEGQIFIYDANGVAIGGERGTWTVREESGEWKIFWTLTTNPADAGAGNIGN